MVSLCAGSALLAQTDEVMERFRCRDLLEKMELVLASCGTNRRSERDLASKWSAYVQGRHCLPGPTR